MTENGRIAATAEESGRSRSVLEQSRGVIALTSKSSVMKIPSHIREIWGPPPLLHHEDPKTYEKLARQIAAAVTPIDVIDWFAVKDVLDLTWEIIRLRRVKMMLIKLKRAELLNSSSSGNGRQAEDGAEDADEAEGAEAAADAAQDAIENQAWLDELRRYYESEPGETLLFLAHLDDLVRIDNLIAEAEVRRAIVLREIERRRAGLADRLRQASNNIIEGECEEPARAQTSGSEAPPPHVLGPPHV
jgi:hypothetical protein